MTKASTSTSTLTEKGKERTGHWFGGGIWKAIARGDKLEWFYFILFSQLLFARSLALSFRPIVVALLFDAFSSCFGCDFISIRSFVRFISIYLSICLPGCLFPDVVRVCYRNSCECAVCFTVVCYWIWMAIFMVEMLLKIYIPSPSPLLLLLLLLSNRFRQYICLAFMLCYHTVLWYSVCHHCQCICSTRSLSLSTPS